MPADVVYKIAVKKIFLINQALQEFLIIAAITDPVDGRSIGGQFFKIRFLPVYVTLDVFPYGANGRISRPVIINDERYGDEPGSNYQEITVFDDKASKRIIVLQSVINVFAAS